MERDAVSDEINESSNGVEDVQNSLSDRSKLVECPEMLSMGFHLSEKFRVPRVAFGQKGLVHHYTDAAGLLGIIKTSRFWASNSVFMNDPTEGSHALRVVQETISNRTSPDVRQQRLLSSIRDVLDEPSDTDTYVVSFCREGDLLGQWRGYGASGSGYSIGFDLGRLTPPPQVASLVEVLYDDNLLRRIADYVLDVYVEHLDRWQWTHVEDVLDWAKSTFNHLAQGFKHSAYREEKEVRLVFRRASSHELAMEGRRPYEVPIKYRAKGTNIVSYLDTSLTFANRAEGVKLPIRQVTVGPGASLEQNKKSIQGLLVCHGYDQAEVVASEVPFRGQ